MSLFRQDLDDQYNEAPAESRDNRTEVPWSVTARRSCPSPPNIYRQPSLTQEDPPSSFRFDMDMYTAPSDSSGHTGRGAGANGAAATTTSSFRVDLDDYDVRPAVRQQPSPPPVKQTARTSPAPRGLGPPALQSDRRKSLSGRVGLQAVGVDPPPRPRHSASPSDPYHEYDPLAIPRVSSRGHLSNHSSKNGPHVNFVLNGGNGDKDGDVGMKRSSSGPRLQRANEGRQLGGGILKRARSAANMQLVLQQQEQEQQEQQKQQLLALLKQQKKEEREEEVEQGPSQHVFRDDHDAHHSNSTGNDIGDRSQDWKENSYNGEPAVPSRANDDALVVGPQSPNSMEEPSVQVLPGGDQHSESESEELGGVDTSLRRVQSTGHLRRLCATSYEDELEDPSLLHAVGSQGQLRDKGALGDLENGVVLEEDPPITMEDRIGPLRRVCEAFDALQSFPPATMSYSNAEEEHLFTYSHVLNDAIERACQHRSTNFACETIEGDFKQLQTLTLKLMRPVFEWCHSMNSGEHRAAIFVISKIASHADAFKAHRLFKETSLTSRLIEALKFLVTVSPPSVGASTNMHVQQMAEEAVVKLQKAGVFPDMLPPYTKFHRSPVMVLTRRHFHAVQESWERALARTPDLIQQLDAKREKPLPDVQAWDMFYVRGDGHEPAPTWTTWGERPGVDKHLDDRLDLTNELVHRLRKGAKDPYVAQQKGGQAHTIRLDDIMKMHSYWNLDEQVTPGCFRTKAVCGLYQFYRFYRVFMPPEEIPIAMAYLMYVLNSVEMRKQHAAVRAYYAFSLLVFFIHPFEDGNGRMARWLGNVFLKAEGYPFVITYKDKVLTFEQLINKLLVV